jgi:hypothetical protein
MDRAINKKVLYSAHGMVVLVPSACVHNGSATCQCRQRMRFSLPPLTLDAIGIYDSHETNRPN